MSEEAFEELHAACRQSRVSSVKELLDKRPELVNRQDPKLGWSCLYRAVVCDNYEIARALLEFGAEPNLQTRMGETALHHAASKAKLKLVQLLLEFDASPHVVENDGNSPLHLAAEQGSVSVVVCLLEHGADPNCCNSVFKRTPLHYAVENSHLEAAQQLLRFGSVGTTEDFDGVTPANLAKSTALAGLFCDPGLLLPSEIIPPIPDLEFTAPSSNGNSAASLKSPLSLELAQYNQRIREGVKQTTVTMKKSRTLSSMQEVELRKSFFPTVKDRANSLGNGEKQAGLYKWLVSYQLDALFNVLVESGYDDLEHISAQMNSAYPLNEEILAAIGVHKPGHRQRLLAALFEESQTSRPRPSTARSNPPSVFRCCSATVPAVHELSNVQTLASWLRGLGLEYVHPLLVQGGYEELEHVLGLVRTPWHLTTETLKNLGVSSDKHCTQLLMAMQKDSGWVKSMQKPYAILNTRRVSEMPDEDSSRCSIM